MIAAILLVGFAAMWYELHRIATALGARSPVGELLTGSRAGEVPLGASRIAVLRSEWTES